MTGTGIADLLAPGVLDAFLAAPGAVRSARRLAVMFARMLRSGLLDPSAARAAAPHLRQADPTAVLRTVGTVGWHAWKAGGGVIDLDPDGRRQPVIGAFLAAIVDGIADLAAAFLALDLVGRRRLWLLASAVPALAALVRPWLADDAQGDGPLRDLAIQALGQALLAGDDVARQVLVALASGRSAARAGAAVVLRRADRERSNGPPREVRAGTLATLLSSGSLRARRWALSLSEYVSLPSVTRPILVEVLRLATTPAHRRSTTVGQVARILASWVDAGLCVERRGRMLWASGAPCGEVAIDDGVRLLPPSWVAARAATSMRATERLDRLLLDGGSARATAMAVLALAYERWVAGDREHADALLRAAIHEARAEPVAVEMLRAARGMAHLPTPAGRCLLEQAVARLLAIPWAVAEAADARFCLQRVRQAAATEPALPDPIRPPGRP
ncbi:MAG: hypothetical protein IPK26_20460 [Planctomycetes bacterium]|nr:hypothetical protein [Planctomycetota bacterium]